MHHRTACNCDATLSFPAILTALLIDGVARASLPRDAHNELAFVCLILAIALSGWVRSTRARARGSTLVEKNKGYGGGGACDRRVPAGDHGAPCLAERNGPGAGAWQRCISPRRSSPRRRCHFSASGLPPTTPSLGTLIRIGNEFLFSGEWWITIFPGPALVLLVLSVNLLGDWLRDALNPKLR